MSKQPKAPVNRFSYVGKPTGYHRLSEEQYRANQNELSLIREEAVSRGMTVAEVRAERKAAVTAAAKAAAPVAVKRSLFG